MIKSAALRQAGVRTVQRLIWSLTLACGWGITTPPALAAERVIIRLGPFEQKIAIAELEQFAKTGELPSHLQLYAPVLNAQVREVLNRRLQLDPNLGDKLIDDLLASPSSKQLVDSLLLAIPGSNVEQIQVAVTLAVRQTNGLSLVSFLRAYPAEDITLDASSAVAVALQFNPSYWQSQALSPLLERELAVPRDTSFNPSFNPSQAGTQPVRQRTLFLQDRQRHRSIPVDIYWGEKVGETSRDGGTGEAGGDKLISAHHSPPKDRLASAANSMVVISHGLGANRKFFTYLAQHLASHGITVAALDHPDSNDGWLASFSTGNNPNELLPASEFVERPKDISFLLDELAKLDWQSGVLQGKLNTNQVSVIGHSLGGYTALALAGAELDLSELRQFCQGSLDIGQAPADWLQCAAADLPEQKLRLRDTRIANAIALNPVVGDLFGQMGLAQVAVPVLILAGTEDTITPMIDHQLRPFTRLQRPKYLLTAIGATHLSISEPNNLSHRATAGSLVKERRGIETRPLRQLVEGVSLAFVKQLTPEANVYQPFLTPNYAQSFSTPALPLRLSTELPASITPWIRAVVQRSQLSSQGKKSKVKLPTPVNSYSTPNFPENFDLLLASLMPLRLAATKTYLPKPEEIMTADKSTSKAER